MTRYDAAMQHSVVARHTAWPSRYVHPAHRARERRLGLRGGHGFTAASTHRTVLVLPEVSPITALHASWRTLVVAPARGTVDGRLRPAAAMAWTSSDRGGGPRRSSLAPAWRA